jgi:hypothetical protein
VQTTTFMSCLLGKDELALCRQVKHGAQNALSVQHLGPPRASGLVSNWADISRLPQLG